MQQRRVNKEKNVKPAFTENVAVKDVSVRKEPMAEGMVKIGMSQGITKNMGNYESYRCDLWLEKVVAEDELDNAVVEMHESIMECLSAMCESQGIEL